MTLNRCFVVAALAACSATHATVLQRETYQLDVDLAADRLIVAAPDGSPLIQVQPLFGITFDDHEQLSPDTMKALPGDDPLTITYTHARADVTVVVDPQPDRIVWRGTVRARQGVIWHVAIPHSFVLIGTPRERFLFPEVLGYEVNEEGLASDRRLGIEYPPAFCDFSGVQVAGSRVHIYRAEAEERPHPAALWLACGDPPVYRHFYIAHVREGDAWSIPALACQIGGDLAEVLQRYKRECRLGAPLEQKLSPEMLERWRGATVATVPAPFDRAQRIVEALPHPTIVEPQAWMYGGFDRMYPDFLPPRAAHGGEKGFRALIHAAHRRGHWVRPYVNFTWWCTGWDGPDSAPAPSYARYGDVALARGRDGALINETYNAEFGYLLSPRAPLAIQRRLEVREALLEDYGVDYLYQDQLGARGWPLDFHDSLDNPADYGWALMRIGREDAARCPIETEFGHDQALAFASAFYYWCLPPLSPIAHWPFGHDPYPQSETWRRSFPYALYLSSGDTVMDIRDAKPPARLAWALLLGARIHLDVVDESVLAGPLRERIDYLQQLARALGHRTLADRLLDFRYLAPRVAVSTWEKHRVVANLSNQTWTLADGTILRPDGFDLRTDDGFRAGRLQNGNGGDVDAMVEPDGNVTMLAAGHVDARWGAIRLVDTPPVPPETQVGRTVVVLDAGPELGGVNHGGFSPADVAEAFSRLNPGFSGPEHLPRKLAGVRVLVNPHSEHLVTDQLHAWSLDLARIRDWIESGGIWVEIGGWPVWIVAARHGDTWQRWQIGPGGYAGLSSSGCQMLREDQTRSSCRATTVGRAVFSDAVVAALETEEVTCHRPPADNDVTILCEAAGKGYLTARKLGHGAIVRIGGTPTAPALKALAETVEALLDKRLDMGQAVWANATVRRSHTTRSGNDAPTETHGRRRDE